MKKKFILFDFDGVIANSFKTAFEVNKMICPHLNEDGYRKLFEGNFNDWEDSSNGHTKECRHDIDFFAEYIPRMKKEVHIVPGMKEVIIELKKNYTLIVVSSTITSPIQEFLNKFDLKNHFTQILGNDVHKSKIEKIKIIFEKYNIEPSDCIFITDTLGDMREASQVGIKSIGITWGFHKPKTLLLGEPFRLIKKPNNLLKAVSDYFKNLN